MKLYEIEQGLRALIEGTLEKIVDMETGISIHALQTECDSYPASVAQKSFDFYPRTPNGVRLKRFSTAWTFEVFLSTHSKRSATNDDGGLVPKVQVFLSTHSKRSATLCCKAVCR